MKRILTWLFPLLLSGWIVADLLIPRQVDLRQFDPAEVARLDGLMWRSYYERKPLLLFWQSAELLRKQVHAPFWRSFVISYHAAKAAFVFKDGKNRADYNRALPDLNAFYEGINQLSKRPVDVSKAARNELEWWIIRREREQHPPAEWAALQTQVVADLYHVPPATCTDYGRLRTEAMLFRDQRGEAITEADWQRIDNLLRQSYQSLYQAVNISSAP
ncbi:hypothetical protein [Spirosoma montaniterrae]|uniref:Uncharacterized protein n=1 Tax=Spirosoma montaniterrae TaxID=1178516 RepID=A0A1P9X2K8_9BACT|nr:hypothetical protein [Spirosoma montaniterrae]AQG81862.1 hypothetical protein AWR27_22700 [Spirosoma montaniterrae]